MEFNQMNPYRLLLTSKIKGLVSNTITISLLCTPLALYAQNDETTFYQPEEVEAIEPELFVPPDLSDSEFILNKAYEVRVSFKVDKTGNTFDIAVEDAANERLNQAAIRAVEQWKYPASNDDRNLSISAILHFLSGEDKAEKE